MPRATTTERSRPMKRTRNGILIPDVPITAFGKLPPAVKGVSGNNDEEYALQSFMPNKPGFNPAVCCKLEQAGFGTYRNDSDKTKGWYLTKEQAAAMQIVDLSFLVTINDINGITGIVGETYTFTSFHEFIHFSSVSEMSGEGSIRGCCIINCTSLKELTMPNGVQTLAAQWCEFTQLMLNDYVIDFPESVTNIDNNAFRGLAYPLNPNYSVLFRSAEPPILQNQSFYLQPKAIFVPSVSVNAYKVAENWSYFASLIEAIPND